MEISDYDTCAFSQKPVSRHQPHLHSYWQAEGGWDGFHANHITFLTAALKAQLLPMGYTAESQQSLQIRRYGEPAGKPESDVTIYRAIGIYDYEPSQGKQGEPVAWLELLSPSNKPGGQDAAYYRNKRWKILQSGTVFVELDYLHESPPTFDGIPFYRPTSKQPEADSDSHPYRIVVADPRPAFDDGKVYPHEFDVDREIPTIRIPLSGSDASTSISMHPIARLTLKYCMAWSGSITASFR